MASGPALALGALTGAVIGLLTNLAASDALAASLAAASLALAIEPARPSGPRRALLVLAIASLAAAQGARARDRALEGPLVTWLREIAAASAAVDAPDARAPVLVSGTLAADAVQADAGVRLLVDVSAVQDRRGPRRVAGRVQAYVSGALVTERMDEWTAGRTIRAWMSLREPRVWRNPGGPSVRWQALTRSHVVTGSIKSALLVDVRRGAWWHEAAAAVRRVVRSAVERFVAPHDVQSAAVTSAILIGDRAGLHQDVHRRLQRAGTYHVIAISGGNVALLTAVWYLALRVLLRSTRAVSLLTILLVLAYGGTVSRDPSVLRAVTAACLVLGVHAIGLVPKPIHVIAVVALLLVFADPLMAIDIGAWLSFAATLGIVVGAARLVRWSLGTASAGRRIVRAALLVPAAGLLAATICAELALLPVQANVFSRVGVAGLFLNFLAIPAMAAVQVAGLTTVVLSTSSSLERLASLAGWITHLAAVVLLDSARLVDLLPWLSWRVPPTPVVFAVLYYGALSVAASRSFRPPTRRLAALATGGIALCIVTAPTAWRALPPAGTLRVTMLDVGQAEAILVQTPDRHSLLVDAGGTAGSFDIGSRVVTSAAWALGVRELDWLLVTHPDLDHAGGAASVARDLRAREVWEGVPVPGNPHLAALREAARFRSAAWRTVRAGHQLELGGVRIDVVHPPEPAWERRRTRNDDSVVLRIRYGRAEVLLTGDAASEFESGWLPPVETAPLRLLKVAHHGSRSSSSEAFLSAYRPAAALVSAGQENLFGHPAAEVLSRLELLRVELFRTDEDGAVIVETDGEGVWIRTAGGRRWMLEMSRASMGPS